jgi:hypothetical protein
MHSEVSSDWLPSYIKATRPVLEIFKMAGHFPDSPRHNCAMQMKMCFIAHQKVVRQVWIFSPYFLKTTTKLLACLFVPVTQRMQNLQFVWLKIQVNMQDAPNTPVRNASRFYVLTGRTPGTAADGSQHSGYVLGRAN